MGLCLRRVELFCLCHLTTLLVAQTVLQDHLSLKYTEGIGSGLI